MIVLYNVHKLQRILRASLVIMHVRYVLKFYKNILGNNVRKIKRVVKVVIENYNQVKK